MRHDLHVVVVNISTFSSVVCSDENNEKGYDENDHHSNDAGHHDYHELVSNGFVHLNP